jgi:hypothetical protein
MSFRLSICMLALVAGIGGDHFYKTKRTFWSKRNIGELSYNHRLEKMNPSAITGRIKRSNINKKLKGFPMLPFSTMIRKPQGRKRANPDFCLQISFSEIEGLKSLREIENSRSRNQIGSYSGSLGNWNNNNYRSYIPFYSIA